MQPARTVLEQKIRERRLTLREFVDYAEKFAREHGEPGMLGLRHLQRLVSGRGPKGQPLGLLRPATARLLEHIFSTDINELLSVPIGYADLDGSTVELRQRIQVSGKVDDSIIELLKGQLDTIRRIDRELGVITNEEVRAKTRQITQLLAYSLSPLMRQKMAALLSDLHTLSGWQSLDLGKAGTAWTHYESAKSSAIESGDASFEAHARGEQAFVLLDVGETALAVNLLRAACEKARRRCPQLLRAWLAAAHGEALAADRQYDECLREFDKAEQLLATDSTDSGGPYILLDQIHLARWRGHALAQLADVRAVPVLMDVLGGLDPTFIRAEAALRLDLATVFALEGDRTQARPQIERARLLAEQVGSVRHNRRLCNLSRTVGAGKV